MTLYEIFQRMPMDGTVFQIETIHGPCQAHFKPGFERGFGQATDRFVFITQSGSVWWHDASPALTTQLIAPQKQPWL